MFVKRLADSPGGIDCIPQNEEKYTTISKYVLVDTIDKNDKEVNIYSRLKFVDTRNFMRDSLEKLVDNLDRSMFKHTSKYFDSKVLDLMLRKEVYPYEYMTDVSKFSKTELPPKDSFNSNLNAGVISNSSKFDNIQPNEISDEDYQHAQKVFKAFDCKNLGDYTELYCKSDVLILAYLFESFIDVCLMKCKLDPSHYITAPSLSWDAMLKMTEVELELLINGY